MNKFLLEVILPDLVNKTLTKKKHLYKSFVLIKLELI
jgi:hypothetical protein